MMQSNTDENEKQNEGRMKRLQMLQNHFTNSESENNFGGAVEFTQELEKKILNMLGKFFDICFICISIYQSTNDQEKSSISMTIL